MEFTNSDLFSHHDWRSTGVTVLGFRLGMKVKDAIKQARGEGRTLSFVMGGACRAGMGCDVSSTSGRFNTNLTLTFDHAGILNSIYIDHSGYPASDGVDDVLHTLRGASRDLVDDYSDSLRAQLLGDATEVKSSPNGVPPTEVYEYRQLGLRLTVYVEQSAAAVRKRLAFLEFVPSS